MQTAEPAPSHDIATLYTEHHGWLLGWLRGRIGNALDAADLAQDTFLRVLASRDAGAVREPRAYLTVVARGLAINWFRRQALERAWLDTLAQLPEQDVPSPERRLIVLETLHRVDALLDALPGRVRYAFLLSQIDSMKYADIAERLGVSLITVKRYMKQAFLHCLAVMDDEVVC